MFTDNIVSTPLLKITTPLAKVFHDNTLFGDGTQGKPLKVLPSAFNIYSGVGSPQSVVTAPIGSLYLRTDGGTNTTLYIKESGTGNTG